MTRTISGWAVVGGATLISAVLLAATRITNDRHGVRSEASRASTEMATVWTVGALGWPLVFHTFVGIEAIASAPSLILALIWPMVLLGHDLVSVNHQTLDNEGSRARAGMTFETNSIASITFAIGGLLMTHMGRRWTEAAVPLLCGVILICIAFVTPRPALQPRSVEGIRVHAIQRVALVYCIGLLSSAVLLVMNGVRRRVGHGLLAYDVGDSSAVAPAATSSD